MEEVDAIAASTVWISCSWPSDLSQAVGVIGDFMGDASLEAVDRVASACRAHGKQWGAVTPSPDYASMLIEKGCTLISPVNDVKLVTTGLAAMKETTHCLVTSQPGRPPSGSKASSGEADVTVLDLDGPIGLAVEARRAGRNDPRWPSPDLRVELLRLGHEHSACLLQRAGLHSIAGFWSLVKDRMKRMFVCTQGPDPPRQPGSPPVRLFSSSAVICAIARWMARLSRDRRISTISTISSQSGMRTVPIR